MNKILTIFSIFIVASCSDVSKMPPEKTEFERCADANIEIIRESVEFQSPQILQNIYDLELIIPIELLEEYSYQREYRLDEDEFDSSFFVPFQRSLQEPKIKSNILAHFSILQSEGMLNYLTQIHLENDDNVYLTMPFLMDNNISEEYTDQLLSGKMLSMYSYGRCPAEGKDNREKCFLQGLSTYAEYYMRDGKGYVLFETEEDFLNHFSKNHSWDDYNSLIKSVPTTRLIDMLESYDLEEERELFKFLVKSSVMGSSDEDLYKIAKKVCHSQGIY